MRHAWIPYLAMITSLTACLTKEPECSADHVRKHGLCVADNASTTGDGGLDDGRDDDAGRDFYDPAVRDGSLDADATKDSAISALCYRDEDRDGFGAGKPVECVVSATEDGGRAGADGAVEMAQSTKNSDCDDRDARRAPGLLETCDGIDNDCDPEIDEELTNECGGACGRRLLHMPGEACANGLLGACTRSGQYVCQGDNAVVCNAPSASPSAELCGDQLDNDCDGLVNEADAVDAPSWYRDCDGDGYARSPAKGGQSCMQPAPEAGCAAWTKLLPDQTTHTNWDCHDDSTSYSPARTSYGLPPSGFTDHDLNCDGNSEKDHGIMDVNGGRRELCAELNRLDCGHWQNAAGDFVLTQPACSSSTARTYPAGYRYIKGGSLTMPGLPVTKAYYGWQYCR